MRIVKKSVGFVILLVLCGVVFYSGYYINSKTGNNDCESEIIDKSVINISECSSEFMKEYYDKVEEVNKKLSKRTEEEQNEIKSNMLIVTSKESLKDTYGANDIINAPNNQYMLYYSSKDEKDIALKNFKKDKSVINAEENIVYTALEVEYDNQELKGKEYNSWGIEKVGLDKASNEVNNRDLDEVVVAILDTGLNVDLFETNYYEKISGTYNAMDNTNDVTDNVGHGTHIAGTIAEGTPDNVKIMSVKVANANTFYDSDIINGINYIVDGKKADVINMSFGGQFKSYSVATAIDAAKIENIICVAAAGNDNTDKKEYPAALSSTMSIAACDNELKKASFSNYGDTITFSAPGVDILSINGTKSGTSMATPHAVCAVAIIKSYNLSYTLDDIITILMKYAQDLGVKGKDPLFGYGFIDLSQIIYCSCSCQNCSGIWCDGCDCDNCECMHENLDNEIDGIKIVDSRVTKYKYGSLTDILDIDVAINYKNGLIKVEELVDLVDYSKLVYNGNYIDGTLTYEGITKDFSIYVSDNMWQYEKIDDNNIKILGTNYDFDGRIVYFPETIDGYTVKEIGDSAIGRKNSLFEIYIPKTIVKIGDNAFSSSYLRIVHIEGNDIEVGKGCFENSGQLEVINIENIAVLGENAFRYCRKLDGRFEFSNKLKCIPKECFKECYHIKEIIIPGNVKKIEEMAFDWESGVIPEIKKITMEEGVEEIGDRAFRAVSIIKIEVPKSVNKIGEKAFGSRLYVYNNSYVQQYAMDNGIQFVRVDVNKQIIVNLPQKEYEAFDTISPNNVSIDVYENGKKETINKNIVIWYQNSSSLRYGDTYCTVFGTSSIGEYIEAKVDIVVSKKTPTYSVPIGLRANEQQKLKEIELPEGFSFMQPEKQITEGGIIIEKIKYTPSDTQNYKIVENIDIIIEVVHSYSLVEKRNPTCSNFGMEEHYKCNGCGKLAKKIDGNFVEIEKTDLKIDKLPHTFTKKVVSKETLKCLCENEDACEFYYTCENCDAISDTLTFKAEHIHNFVNYNLVKKATISEDGIRLYSCDFCGKTNEIAIPKVNKIALTKSEMYYTGKALTQDVVVKDESNSNLIKDKDYSVTYKNNINKGTATVIIKGINDYDFEKALTFKIANGLEKAKVTGIVNKTYTGSKQTQKLTVKCGSKTLKNGTDYTVSYKNNVNKGTATVTITGKGKYAGIKTLTFKISARSITKLSFSKVKNYTYTGKTISPNVTVKYGKKALVKNTDYTISYSKNKNKGTATITIKGKGNYSGTKKITFKIAARKISSAKVNGIVSKTYNKKAQTQSIKLTYNGMTLKNKTDYTVSYKNNKNKGTATVTITGKGNYTGSVKKTFKIKAKSISGLTFSSVKNYMYTGKAIRPSVTVKYGSTKLKSGTNYTIKYSNNTKIGTATITITGKGNYSGTKKITFKILSTDIAKATVESIKDVMYTGSAITPNVVVKTSGVTLTKNKDYTVSYQNNTNVGTATIIIKGIGKFKGTKSVFFQIIESDILVC